MTDLNAIDENAPIGNDLPDKEFVQTREAILLLLPRLFRPGTMRWSDYAVVERLVDETVDEIGHIWRSYAQSR